MRVYLSMPCILLCLLPSMLTGQDLAASDDSLASRYEEKKYKFQLDYFYPQVTTEIRLDAASGSMGLLDRVL